MPMPTRARSSATTCTRCRTKSSKAPRRSAPRRCSRRGTPRPTWRRSRTSVSKLQWRATHISTPHEPCCSSMAACGSWTNPTSSRAGVTCSKAGEECPMRKGNYLFTSESVSEGHPDKVCDRISDTVVDAFLAADPYSRVACETLVTTQRIVIAGEVRGPGEVIDSLEDKIRAAIKDIGYEQHGFHWATADYACHLHAQSADIAMGVDAAGNKDEGAGDQGIMFGYATNE